MMFTSCEKSVMLESSETDSVTKRETAPVTLTFFDVSTEDITTPVESRADEVSALKKNGYFTHLDITFFPQFADGDTVSIHQVKEDDDFGKVNVYLELGEYKIVAIAHKSTDSLRIKDMTAVAFPETWVPDMAYLYTTLKVETSTNAKVCQLNRAVAGFCLSAKDVLPNSVTTIKVTYKNDCSYKFNPTTSFAIDTKEITCTLELNPAGQGKKRSCHFFAFLPKASQNVDIHVDILNSDGTVFNKFDFDDVLLEQGKRTIYTGNLCPSSTDFTFESSTTKLEDIETSSGSKEF